MAEDILGIVGHADLTDLDKGFEEVIDHLAKVGQYVGRVNNQFESLKHSREASDILISGLTELVEKTREADEEIRKLGDSPQDLDKLLSKLEDYKGKTGEIAIASRAAYFEQKNYVESLKGFADNIEQMAQKAKDTESLQKLASMHSQISDAIDTETERLDALQDQLKKADDTYKHTEEAIKRCTEELEKQSDATEKAGKSVENAAENTSSVSNWLTGNGKLQEGVDAFKKSLLELPLPISNVTKGLGGMLAAMRAMIATPLGAMLAGITLAFQTLFQWLNKSKDGQIAFAKISAYVGSILSSIGDIVIKVGRYIFKSFTDPQGALHDFGVAVVKGAIAPIKVLIHAIQAVSSTMKALWDSAKGVAMIGMALKSGDWDEFGMYWDKAKNSFKNAGKEFTDAGESILHTVDNMVEGIYNTVDAVKELGKGVGTIGKDIWDAAWDTDLSNVFSDMLDKANKAKDLAGIQKETEIKISQAKEKEAALDAEIAASREKIYTLTGAERLKEIENLKQLQKSKYDDRIKAYQKMYDIQKATLDLHENTLEDEEKSRQLNIQLLQLKAQQAAATRMTTRLEESTKRAMANEGKRGAKQSAAVSAANARMDESIRSIELQRIQLEHDLEQKIADAKIAAMKEGFQKTQAERKRENEAELDALEEQRKKLIEQEYQRQKKIHQDEQAVIKAKGGKVVNWDDSMFDKSSEEITTINKLMDDLVRLTLQKQKNAEEEIQKQRIQSMYDYLKEYGTFEEAKYAIAKEYAKKIAEAEESGNTYEVKRLEAERDKNLGSAKARELAQGIDFSQVIYGLSDVMDGVMQETLQRIRDYRQTDEFKNSNAESKKAISDLEKQLLDKGVGGSISPFGSWKEINKHAEEFDAAIQRTTKAEQQHLLAKQNLEKQEQILANMRKDPSADPTILGLQKGIVEAARQAFEETGEELQDAQQDQDSKGQRVQNDLSQVDRGLQEFNTMLGQITSGSLTGFANGLSNLIALFTKDKGDNGKGLTGLIGEKAAGIVGAIISIIDTLGDKPVEFLDDLFNKITNAITAIIQNLPQILGSVVTGVGKMIGGLFGSIGGLFGLDFSSSNKAETERENAKLANATSVNTEAINRLTEEIKKASPSKAYESWEDAKRLMQQNEENAKRVLENNAYMYDGGHSLNYDLGSAGGVIEAIFKYLGIKPTRGAYDLGSLMRDLTAENWNKLLKDRPDLMTKLGQAISGAEDEGNYNGIFQDILNFAKDYSKEAYDELWTTFQESVTGVSLDSFKNKWTSMLMDLSKKNKDYAQDFTEQLTQSFLNAQIEKKFGDRLKQLYEDWANFLTSGDDLTEAELAELKRREEELINEMQAERDRIFAITGYDRMQQEQQSATFNSAQNITYEQADSLVGIETAQLIAQEQMRDLLQVQTDAMNDVALQMPYVAATLDNINAGVGVIIETQNSMNNHLAEISVNTAVLPNMRDEIVKMRRLIEEQ